MFIADLHIHSRYSRATSQANEPIELEYWCRRKGMDLLASGDFTHAAYRSELREKLMPLDNGLYALKDELRRVDAGIANDIMRPRFIISSEISSIYKDKGKTRKVHNVILVPSIEAADKISLRLEALGCNLRADGRPIIGLSSHNLLELTLDCCAEAIFIPAHIWTPHFSLFGMYSGYDTIEDCFEDLTPHIHALETGLSSDPQMNARISALDKYAFVSNSDAHSPANLAREANLFNCELTYDAMAQALAEPQSKNFHGTIEFFPEEGKYHWDGHRNCKYSCKPSDAIANGNICPVCGEKLILGVSHRLEELADRPEDYISPLMRPYQSLVPLSEIIAACARMTKASKKVQAQYQHMLQSLGSELYILRQAPLADIADATNDIIAEGISRIRAGKLTLAPGFDGEYGKVSVFSAEELDQLSGQTSLFANLGYEKQPRSQKQQKTAAPIAADTALPAQTESDLPYGLNGAQWQAVAATNKEIVVMAGPGTGKTRTLIYRIIHLLEKGVAPEKIMAVTFTNKAAGELRERLLSHFKSKKMLSKMNIGTFHSLSLKMLREQGETIALVDANNARCFAEEVIAEQGLKMRANHFLREISHAKNNEKSDLSEAAISAYQQKLLPYHAYDFDDLLLSVLNFASENPGYFADMHLLVDEFQDINDLQMRLIEAWRQEAADTFVIGDPNQSIYGFRGADAACFERFLQHCSNPEQIYLRENYRSTTEILACASAFVNEDEGRQLHTERTLHQSVRLVDAETPLSEGIFIATEIDRLIGGIDMITAHSKKSKKSGNISLADIAILYRTHRQAEQLSFCLEQAGIPHSISGRDDFMDDEQVRLCLAFLRAITDASDQLARHLCQSKFPAAKLDGLFAAFRPLLAGSSPAQLVEKWIDSNYLGEHPALEKLHHTALLCPDLSALLFNSLLGEEADIKRSGSKEYAQETVSLLTLHGAKGLEFPVVFIAGLKEGLLPFYAEGMTTDRAEERRLFYVGITRAKDELILLSQNEPSSFLSEIDSDLLTTEKALEKKRRVGKQLALFD